MIVLLACLIAAVAAAPQEQEAKPIAIIFDERSDSGNGNFRYNFETENGIAMDVSGTPGAEGQVNMEGVYRFPFPDGTIAEVRFIADEAGYRPESPLLPTPPPPPAHALELIRIAQEQRAQGITFDDQGKRITR